MYRAQRRHAVIALVFHRHRPTRATPGAARPRREIPKLTRELSNIERTAKRVRWSRKVGRTTDDAQARHPGVTRVLFDRISRENVDYFRSTRVSQRVGA